MLSVHRLRIRLIPVAALILLALTACGGRITNDSWAGMSTNGRQVFVASGPGVLAYDTVSQTQNWIFPSDPSATLLFYSAPSYEDGRVIFGDYGRAGGFLSPRVTVSVYALDDTESGTPTQLWTNSTSAGDKIVAPTLQVGDQVFIGTADNHVYALNASDGTEQWDFQTEHAVWGQPSYRDGILYVASMDWTVYALNAASGELIWSTKLGGALPSSPVLGDDLLYVASFEGGVHALDIATGERRWMAPAENWVWGEPALADDTIYFGDIDGNLFAVDAQTGERRWTKATTAAVQTSPVAHDGVLYVASQITSGDPPTGALTAYSMADGSEIWQRPTVAPLYTSPVIVGEDTIVVAQQSADALLIGIDLASGQELWRYSLPETTN